MAYMVTGWFRRRVESLYERLLEREISGGPTHVAVIQDGNRRYARRNGEGNDEGYRAGARTTERILRWCQDLGIEELTLYTFSTENFDRPAEQRELLFDLIVEKFHEFADAEGVHENEVCIRAIGEVDRLPERVQEAVDYAEGRTEGYDEFVLNVALAYGGRNELLSAAREIAGEVERGELAPEEVDVDAVEDRLYDRPVREVDLIVRTGGDERTSNFLPWYANGNEAAVFFCAPYWPEFSRIDFLRAVRTYEHREQSWRRTRARRALALLGALGEGIGDVEDYRSLGTRVELPEARAVVGRFRDSLPSGERPPAELAEVDDADRERPPTG
jgi:tritrans,polycis-undecaprenyl-diphosphate synthase [geranylgeranyl-diphosphate specific]